MQWYENEFNNLKSNSESTKEDFILFINKLVEQLQCYNLLYGDLTKTINTLYLSKNTNKTIYLRDIVPHKFKETKRDITIIKK